MLAAAIVLIAVELAATHSAPRIADPCEPRAAFSGQGLDATVQRIVLDGLDGAACRLGTSRERLVLSIAGDKRMRVHASDAQVTTAVRGGVLRALDEAAARGDVPAFALPFLRRLVEELPIDQLVRGSFSLGSLL
ncbi:MAG TPA: hypothetical protein VGQ38_02675 [Gaiellaceae bacterium]|nr:hypothetical protein [Gaiellaceae bacterium]